MTPRDFCFWLQGYFEILRADANKKTLPFSLEQVALISKHLDSVFESKVMPPPMPAKEEGQQTGEDQFRKFRETFLTGITTTGPKFEPPLTVTC